MNGTRTVHLRPLRGPDFKSVYFEYDALGRRTSKFFDRSVTRWVWDGNTPLHEWSYPFDDRPRIVKDEYGFDVKDREEPTDNVITWVFEEGTFKPMAKLSATGNHSIVTDHLGTPAQMYDGQGVLTWDADFDIYGKVRNFAGSSLSDCPFRYQGQYEDQETGLYYNRFRYYDPSIGNYLSQDPIGLAGNNPTLYGYVKDTNYWLDVLGLYPAWNPNSNRWHDSNTGRFMKRPTDLMQTSPGTAHFWSGRTNGIGGADVAADIAKANNGTTLEMLIKKNNIVMPEWDASNPIHVREWEAMSGAYADSASGKVRGVIGDNLRPDNIWEGVERNRLMNSSKVTSIEVVDPKTGKSKGFIKGSGH